MQSILAHNRLHSNEYLTQYLKYGRFLTKNDNIIYIRQTIAEKTQKTWNGILNLLFLIVWYYRDSEEQKEAHFIL